MSALRFQSTARSHAGSVRLQNEDGYLDRADARLWAVADGMGGHRNGAEASALVIDSLARIEDVDTGYALLNAVEAALGQSNDLLIARRADLPGDGIMGATVVALLVREAHAACLWAGDSRAYHLSAGVLKPLTRDHSLAQELADMGGLGAGGLAPRANVITRAVGAAETLRLERAFAPVAAGDRFLLCSDGLTGVLSEGRIHAMLGEGSVDDCADTLLAAALQAGAPDNVTLIAVEIC